MEAVSPLVLKWTHSEFSATWRPWKWVLHSNIVSHDPRLVLLPNLCSTSHSASSYCLLAHAITSWYSTSRCSYNTLKEPIVFEMQNDTDTLPWPLSDPRSIPHESSAILRTARTKCSGLGSCQPFPQSISLLLIQQDNVQVLLHNSNFSLFSFPSPC